MKSTLEKLWNDYLADESCKVGKEEKELIKKASEEYEALSKLLNKESLKALEKQLDTICEPDAIFAKKAFMKGCEFSISFLPETLNKEPS